MNFSKDYIKMCDCDEVQKHRKPESNAFLGQDVIDKYEIELGDYYYFEPCDTDLNEGFCSLFIGDKVDNIVKYFDNPYFCADYSIRHKKDTYYFKKVLWLPFQYQIQQMIHQYGSCSFKLLQDFYNWCIVQRKERIETIKGCTLEELWLMFYMWREHYKIWNGERWIEEKNC